MVTTVTHTHTHTHYSSRSMWSTFAGLLCRCLCLSSHRLCFLAVYLRKKTDFGGPDTHCIKKQMISREFSDQNNRGRSTVFLLFHIKSQWLQQMLFIKSSPATKPPSQFSLEICFKSFSEAPEVRTYSLKPRNDYFCVKTVKCVACKHIKFLNIVHKVSTITTLLSVG